LAATFARNAVPAKDNPIVPGTNVSLAIAFGSGLLSFISPCVLPLAPIYLIQLAGPGIIQTEHRGAPALRVITFLHALCFVIGFTLAFIALGATASVVGSFLAAHQLLLRRVGGILLVILGLQVLGVLKVRWLHYERRFHFRPQQPHYAASLLIGFIFAIGWTPCVGLILAPILALAAQAATLSKGVLLLIAYSAGLGLPFLAMGLAMNEMSRLLRPLKPHLGKVEALTGVFLIIMGFVIYFNLLFLLNQVFSFA
jgi:cytochrome c-type biogenesis protein